MNIITAHTGMPTWDGIKHWVPPSKKSWDWYTKNKNGDVHIFEDGHIIEHINYNKKIKIALLEEVPDIYDYAKQFDPHMFHPYEWIKENHQHFDYVMSTYKFLENIVGKHKYHWICFHVCGIALENYGMYEKQRNLSIIVSPKKWTKGHKMRHEIVAKFGNYMDVYGSGYNNLINNYNILGKIIGLAPYCFSITIPNTNIDDFFSEQLTDAMAVSTIPVFCGTKNVSKYFNPDGIIQFDTIDELEKIIPTLNMDLYQSKIKSVMENLEISKKYKTTVDWLYENKKNFLENAKKQI